LQNQESKTQEAKHGQLDALADENRRLREQLERITRDQSHYRVLIAASIDKSIEVYADPQVRVQVLCLPETKTPEEYERAEEWALSKVPHEFQDIMQDVGIKPELHSVRCMTKGEWRYYFGRIREAAYIEQLGEAVEEITTQAEVQQASQTGAPAPDGAPSIPW